MLNHAFSSPQKPARVVIMGAGGFIGRAIANRLEAGGLPVVRLTRKDVNLLAADAGDKLASLLKPQDVFIAAAAIAPCKTSAIMRDNMILTAAIIAALTKSPVAHVINISSDAVYADTKELIVETSVTSPDNSHGVMHLAREVLFRQEIKLPLATLRPTLVYGADDPHNGYGPNKFRRLANRDEPIVLFGKGEERRDHVSVYDIAEITRRVAAHGSTGVLNIATGTVTSFREIADAVVRFAGRMVAIEDRPRSGPLPHNGYRAFSTVATFAAFPEFSYTPLQQGLAETQKEEFGNGASASARIAS